MAKSILSDDAKMVLKAYQNRVKGSEAFLTDAVKRAIIAEAIVGVMIARFEWEEKQEQQAKHSSPNRYVEVLWELQKFLDL